MPRPRGRRAYDRVSSDAQEPEELTTPDTTLTDDDNGSQSEEAGLNEEDHIELVIMDPAHRKFKVSAHPEWLVEDLKAHGAKIFKVPAGQQRLVYMGRLLQDEETLQDVGLTEPKTIIHLFPKPRVVVSARNEEEDTEDTPIASDGAHVPRIVLDPDEAERRSSILVLGSAEIIEAQNNVKLLSFLLLIISSMELLALLTVWATPPPVPDPSTPPPTPAGASDDDAMFPPQPEMEMRTWRNSDYVDLAISALGFYVATLGIKATTENTMRLAKQYLIGTVAVGIAWNIFYYYLNIQAEKEADQKRVDATDDDEFGVLPDSTYYVQAAFAIMLPAMLWFVCCVRAWQFHGLLQEAEAEAEERIRNERIRNEISDIEQGAAAAPNDGDHELTMQNETARIT